MELVKFNHTNFSKLINDILGALYSDGELKMFSLTGDSSSSSERVAFPIDVAQAINGKLFLTLFFRV